MGIPGLMTYMLEGCETFFLPHELCDCYLIVDGSNICCYLYQCLSDNCSAFGGDYDMYYATVKSFFQGLKLCKVKPIIIFDGGHEKKKLKKSLANARSCLTILKSFIKGLSACNMLPLFLKETFCDVMEELKITCIQCDLEADAEIAAIARALNCPVLSNDSDFFVFDVLYIPLALFSKKPVKFCYSNNYYIKCSIFRVTHFLSKFEGLDKSLLPMAAILLGNDYVQWKSFEKLFNHISLPKGRKSYSQKRIGGLLHWLKKENFESAVEKILLHLGPKKKQTKFAKALKEGLTHYRSSDVSECVLQKLEAQIGALDLPKKSSRFTLPPEVKEIYSTCRLQKFIIDMITLNVYLTYPQVECMNRESSHYLSFKLISDIYIILRPYLKCCSKPLKLYLIQNNDYTAVTLKTNDLEKNITINDLLEKSEDVRVKWLCGVLGVDDEFVVPRSDWSIFILSFIYWIKKANHLISLAHIHALILMAMANQIVKKRVGYCICKNYSAFEKRKRHLLNSSKNEPEKAVEGKGFKQMLDKVTLQEKLLVYGNLVPFREPLEASTGQNYSLATVHLFNAFQSCLHHIMQINVLLNYPFPHLKISDFYSGTLLYNFYTRIKAKPEVEKFASNLFKDAPNLQTVYAYLSERLCQYSDKPNVVREPTNKKRKRKKKSSKKTEEEIGPKTPDESNDETDGAYNDENNQYAVLHWS